MLEPVETVFRGSFARMEALPFGVRRLVLARPEVRNAFNAALVEELSEALDRVAAEDAAECRLLVLTGDGPVFCAGADLAYMRAQAAQGPEENLRDARALAGLYRRLASLPVPVVGAVRGAAMGGALGLVACCDFVLAEEQTVFALPEVRLGILPAVIGPYLVRKLGPSGTGALALSGRRLGALQALAAGLVHRVAPAPRMAETLGEILADFLKAGPEASRRTKEWLLRLSPLPPPELEEEAASLIASARASAEGQAGLAAFLSRLPAPWVPDFGSSKEPPGGERA